MKKLVAVLGLIIFCTSAYAQFGINAGLRTNGTTDWQPYVGDSDFLKSGFKVGLDYWFRLKKVRVEFTPEVNFSQFKSDFTSNTDDTYNFKANVYGLHLNTSIYPLNFKDDCNCPTFKKDGQVIEKGFHFILSPGINYFNLSINKDSYITNDYVFSAGAGVGLDIGLTDFLTITPLVMYHRYFDADWKDLDQALGFLDASPEGASTNTDINQFFFGAKMSIRFDEMNKYGYR